MTIDIGNNDFKQLDIFQNDDPYQIAFEFCVENKLGAEMLDILKQNIEENIDQLKNINQQNQDIQQYSSNIDGIQKYLNTKNDHQQEIKISKLKKWNDKENQNKGKNIVQQYLTTNDDINQQQKQNQSINFYESPIKQIKNQQKFQSETDVFKMIIDKKRVPLSDQTKEFQNISSYNTQKDVNKINQYSPIQYRPDFLNISIQKSTRKSYEEIQYKFTPTINENSKKICNQKPLNESVHERLYKSAKKKSLNNSLNINDQNKSKSAKKTSRSHIDFYQQGINQLKKKLLFVEKKQKEQQEKENQNLTFKPIINQKTQEIVIKSNRKQGELVENLNAMWQQRIFKFKQQKLLQEQNEIWECSFKPEINKNSNELAQKHRSLSHDKISKMHNVPDFKFQPIINEKSKQIVKDGEFHQRQQQFLLKKNLNLKMNQEMNEKENIDQNTGQVLFQPQIGRGPKNQRFNEKNQNLWSYLNEPIKQINKNYSNIISIQDNKKSNQIYEKLKWQKFTEIFQQLDSDGDGEISAKYIDISQIQIDVLKIISPLLQEMEQLNVSLNHQEFLESAFMLFNELGVTQKNMILKSKLIEQKVENSFIPQINDKSKKICEKNSQYIPLFDIQQRNQLFQNKIDGKFIIIQNQTEKQ